MATSIGSTIYSSAKKANLDEKYGPYASLEAALATTALSSKLKTGLTIGIITATDGDGNPTTIEEYWYQNGAFVKKQPAMDTAPTEDSENAVESGGIYTALAGKQDTISDLETIRSGAEAGTSARRAVAAKADLVSRATEGNLASLTNTGNLADSGAKVADFATKVSNPTSGNLAGLDENGNLTDSGAKASDFATAAQGTNADNAIQGIRVNGTTQSVDNDKIANLDIDTTVGEYKWVAYDSTVVTALANIGDEYTDPIGDVDPADMGASTIILMPNGDDPTAEGYKVMMIVSQNNNDTFVYKYISDLNGTMPTNILTQSDIVALSSASASDTNKVVNAAEVSQIAQEVTNLSQSVSDVKDIAVLAGDKVTYEFSAAAGSNLKKFIDVPYVGKKIRVKVVWDNTLSPSALVLYQSSSTASSGIIGTGITISSNTEVEFVVDNSAKYLWVHALAGANNYDVVLTYYYPDAYIYGLAGDISSLQTDVTAIGGDVTVLQTNKPVRVTYDGTAIAFLKVIGGVGMEYTFKAFGDNSLIQLYKIDFYKNGTIVRTITVGTDSLGPYQVSASSNADGDNSSAPKFTGGCHGYDGTQNPSNTKTASVRSSMVALDGKEVTANGTYYGYEASLIVTNGIQGWNTRKADGTGREILTETIEYKLGCGNDVLVVSNVIEALEDLTIELYYGMQIAFVRQYIRFVGEGKSEWYGSTSNASYGGNVLDAVETKTGSVEQGMFVKPIGLGHFGFLGSGVPMAFRSAGSSQKSYYNLINGVNCVLSTGDSVRFEGGYYFRYKGNEVVINATATVASNNTFHAYIDVSALRGKTVRSMRFSWDTDDFATSGNQATMYQSTGTSSATIITSGRTVTNGVDYTTQFSVEDNAVYMWFFKLGTPGTGVTSFPTTLVLDVVD